MRRIGENYFSKCGGPKFVGPYSASLNAAKYGPAYQWK